MNQLLLYDLFEAVKKDKRLTPIGTQQYFFLLELFKKNNYPVETYQQLLFVCEVLWLKSKEQQPAFREIFAGFKNRIESAFAEAMKRENEDTAEASISSAAEVKKPGSTVATSENKEQGQSTQASATGEQLKSSNDSEKSDTEQKNLHEPGTGEMRFSLGSGDSSESLSIRLQEETVNESVLNIPYLFNDDYFPLNNRQLSQYWRNLTSRNPGNELPEIDFPASIKRIGRQGFVDRLLYNRELQNQLSLVIFIDQGGSMQCYEEFGWELVKSASDSKVHPTLHASCFYNVPMKNKRGHYQLWSTDQTKSFQTETVFRERNKKDTVVVIYSDAGAAKGNYNQDRINNTQAFIKYLQQQTAYAVWLNPMPKRRWLQSTAGAIAALIPMFETGRQGMTNAVAVLRGSSI